MRLILSILLVIASIVESKFFKPYFPVATLVILFPLSFNLSIYLILPLAFFAGVIKDSLFPEFFWFSPLFFIIIAFFSALHRMFINPKQIIFKFTYFLLFTFLYISVVIKIHHLSIDIPPAIISAITTAFVAFCIEWWWKER